MSKKRVRLSATERKDLIVSAAMQVMAEKGYAGTSFQLIADKCEVSQSAVLHHFKNKEELLEGVLTQLLKHNHDLVAALMSEEDSAKDRLMKHFRGNLEWANQYEAESQILVLLYYLASFEERFSRLYAEIQKNARVRIRAHVLAGMRENIFRSDLDADRVAETLHDTLVGSFVNYVTIRKTGQPQTDPTEKWERLIQTYEKK